MKKLLIIEDHPMMRMFLQNYLSKSYEVTTVSTPEEALDYSTKNTFPDLILSDYKDKQSKDFQMLQCLCMQIEWRNIPLFVLTDQDKSQERINALELGAKDTLSKPFNPKELIIRIDAMLNVSSSLNTIRTVA